MLTSTWVYFDSLDVFLRDNESVHNEPGKNDIDNPACELISATLARDIVPCTQWLIEGFSVHQVAVLQLMQCRRTHRISVNLFNSCVDHIDDVLKTLYSSTRPGDGAAPSQHGVMASSEAPTSAVIPPRMRSLTS